MTTIPFPQLFVDIQGVRIRLDRIISYSHNCGTIYVNAESLGKSYKFHFSTEEQAEAIIHQLDQLTAPINLIP